jgi:hypothetical protein
MQSLSYWVTKVFLVTTNECDMCNDFFGRGIENDFGNWSKPMRTMARIRGKTGVPTIKRTDRGWRIEGVPEGLNVKHEEGDDPPFEVDEAKKEMVFKLTRDPYTPVAVLKAFVKMGLTLLPEEEMPNFPSALKWIRTEDHSIGTVFDWSVFHTFMPGSYRNDLVSTMVFRRKSDDIDLPYGPCQLKQPQREIRPGLTVGNPGDLRTGCNRFLVPKT